MGSSPSIGLKEIWLILYNSFCCGGWAIVLTTALNHLATGGISEHGLASVLASVYVQDNLEQVLIISQVAALAEILHSMIGIVRSPWLTTSMQVASRITALIAITLSPDAQSTYILFK